ncbi:unnamed protein product [Allacma fusca]|uniref:Carboxylesterase type B domain-containing protein n=1 Tax=Allacma fusca TaxID=39272 RepID=A0A8J2P1U1_9HEXA|nr:unnamed protein product [Allacma fusca]
MKLLTGLGIFIQVCFNKVFLGMAPTDFGVAHADDLPLLFWIPFVFKFSPDEEADTKFSKDFVKLWASFAKNEKMFFRGVEFTPVSNGQLKYLDLNDSPKMIRAPFQERMEFLESLGIQKLRVRNN